MFLPLETSTLDVAEFAGSDIRWDYSDQEMPNMAHWVVSVGVEYRDVYGRIRTSKVDLSGFQYKGDNGVTNIPVIITPVELSLPEFRPSKIDESYSIDHFA